MADRDRFELDMAPGTQPPSGFGDRLLVGLALVVLVAGAVIGVGKVLPNLDQAAKASAEPSAGATRTPRPSPTPAPPRVLAIEDPDIDISPAPQTNPFAGWVRALQDIVVRTAPDPEAGSIGVLARDEVAAAYQQEGSADALEWLYLEEPSGYIQAIVDGVEQVHRYEYPRYRYSGGVNSLVSGPDGFAAIVFPPGGPDVAVPSRTAWSSDGGSWRTSDESLVDTWSSGSIAWGPAGWLAATYVTDGSQGRIWIWSSADGLRWTRLGMLGGLNGEYVSDFIGSEAGYLLETVPQQSGSAAPRGPVWSSTDGLTWIESTDPVSSHRFVGDRRMVALQGGFYLWDAGENAAEPDRFAAFSVDGRSWSEIGNAPDGLSLHLASFAGGIVAIDLHRESLAPRVWSAVVEGGQVSWIRESSADAAFRGAVVTQLVSDGARAYAFGWDATTEAPLVWSGDGVHWARSALPESFGGIPTIAAAGPAGVVVLGHRHTLRGDNPIFWHRTPTGRWTPEPDPVLEVVPDPTTNCAPLPGDLLDYVVADAAALIGCHGSASITFRAFSVACVDCYGEGSANLTPAWLLDPRDHQLYLGRDASTTDWISTAILGPSLEPDPTWNGQWIQVTGHFDDPEASSCHQDIDPDSVEWWSGVDWVVDQCRETFVVTAVQVVDGP
jgi:hypothetical protein